VPTYPAKKQTKVTRLKNIEATRVDGVDGPANGFPVLMMKSIELPNEPAKDANPAADGAVKESSVTDATATEKAAQTTDQPETPEDGQEVTPEVVKAEGEDPAPEAPEAEIDPVVASAIAKAVQPLEAANTELRDELAKLKATPIPGQIALTAPADARAITAKAENLAKAAKYRQLAERVTDREQRRYYLDRAKELEAV
jgi:hypothetical protein